MKKLKLLILSLVSVSWLTACGPNKATPTTNSSVSGEDTLKLLYWQSPTILNPHLSTGTKDFEAARITYEPLATYNQNDQLIPFLAAEIPTNQNGGIARDGKSVIWKLRQGVKWSDGEPFTAKDVVFTFQFVTNKAVASATAENFASIKNVEAINDHTIKINFKAPNPAWDVPFTGVNGLILPQHIFEKYNGANVREAPANMMPIGTGPYKVVAFKPGDVVVYERNNSYWGGKPFFPRVEIKGGGDATSAARAVLQTGDADYAFNLQVETNILQQLEAGGKGKVIANFGSYVERVMFNFTDPNKSTADGERSSVKFPHPFFSDKRVREAFNLAIDRDTISQKLYGATGKPTAQTLVAPTRYKSNKITYEFNLKKAGELLDAAGWKDTNNNKIRDKNGVEMKVLFQTSVNPVRQKSQEIIKQALQSLDIGVELKSIDASVFFGGEPSNTDNLNHFYADLQMLNTGNDSPDPGPHTKWWTCSEISQKSNQWQSANYARYCNPKYDELWQQATTEIDPQKRAILFQKLDEILAADVALMPLVIRANATGVSNRLSGVNLTPWDATTWNIKEWQRQ